MARALCSGGAASLLTPSSSHLAYWLWWPTYSSSAQGESGGVFGPALCIGVLLGRSLEEAVMQWALMPLNLKLLPLFGVAAFPAGSMQAPPFAAVLVPEISGDLSLLPYSAITSVGGSPSAWVLLRGYSIHVIGLEGSGVKMGRPLMLEVLKVEDLMTRAVIALPYDAPLTALKLLSQERDYAGCPVIRGGSLVGTVPLGETLRKAEESIIGEPAERHLVCVYADDSAYSALEKM